MHRLVLGQVKVTDKSNEITAIPALLELLDRVAHSLDVSLPLMQWVHAPAIAAQISNAKANYILALKANHPTLHEQVKVWFEQAQAQGFGGHLVAASGQRVRPSKGTAFSGNVG